ncbi:hypothetical protein AB0E01_39980 [Nocardia vinacea]|uniref:hypothetical protein n=1 Tax=Nocardia vinacea TaxID=96468 RepID=UPI0033D2A87A
MTIQSVGGLSSVGTLVHPLQPRLNSEMRIAIDVDVDVDVNGVTTPHPASGSGPMRCATG